MRKILLSLSLLTGVLAAAPSMAAPTGHAAAQATVLDRQAVVESVQYYGERFRRREEFRRRQEMRRRYMARRQGYYR